MTANWSIVCRMCLNEYEEMQSVFEKWCEIDLKLMIKESLNLDVC